MRSPTSEPPALRYRMCRTTQAGVHALEWTETISGDDAVEGSFAFNSKYAASLNDRHVVGLTR